jgi:hypothetical protein
MLRVPLSWAVEIYQKILELLNEACYVRRRLGPVIAFDLELGEVWCFCEGNFP